MEMQENEFKYTYSAPTEAERREIANIRRQYEPITITEESIIRIRRLHSKVKNIPSSAAIATGTVGLLIFGLGLTCILEWQLSALGIILGVIGIVPIALACPLYNFLSARLKKKYAPEILALSENLE